MANTLLIVVNIAFTLAVGLLLKFLGSRVVNMGRVVPEKLIEDYRHENQKALASLSSAYQVRQQEFNLFAQRQHLVYARLAALARKSGDLMRGQVGFVFITNFERYDAARADAFLRENSIVGTEADRAVELYREGNTRDAAMIMHEFERGLSLRAAARAFKRFKNFVALNDLFLSDTVRDSASLAAIAIGNLYTEIDARGVDEYQKRLAAVREVERSVNALVALMRTELTRGIALAAPLG